MRGRKHPDPSLNYIGPSPIPANLPSFGTFIPCNLQLLLTSSFMRFELFEQSGSFLNAPTAHPEERSDEGSQK